MKANAVSSLHLRTVDELRKKMVNICQRCKEAQNRREAVKTGGGSAQPQLNELQEDHRNYRDCISGEGFWRFRYLRGYHFG